MRVVQKFLRRGRPRLVVPPAFNRNSPTVTSIMTPEESGRWLLERMRQQIGFSSYAKTRLLDFGCGVRFSQALVNTDFRIGLYVGIDIDRPMPAPSPRLNVLVRGRKVPIDLTRRRFLCVLLAFLTAESLVLVVGAIFAQTVAPTIRDLVADKFHFLCLYIGLFFYLLFFWQMMVVTFVGLFYLGDRIHQPDDA